MLAHGTGLCPDCFTPLIAALFALPGALWGVLAWCRWRATGGKRCPTPNEKGKCACLPEREESHER